MLRFLKTFSKANFFLMEILFELKQKNILIVFKI